MTRRFRGIPRAGEMIPPLDRDLERTGLQGTEDDIEFASAPTSEPTSAPTVGHFPRSSKSSVSQDFVLTVPATTKTPLVLAPLPLKQLKRRKPRSKGTGSFCVMSPKGKTVHCYETEEVAERVARAFGRRSGATFVVRGRQDRSE